MDTHDTTPPPAWLNLDAVVDEETVATLHELADSVEAALQGLAPLLERSYRTLHKLDGVDLGPFGQTYGGGDGVYEAIHVFSGARRLSDLLYLLAAHVEGASGEKVDDHHDIPWLTQARADLGLDEWNVTADTER
ncbi:MAG: hypothetical protein M3450_11550 [Actinomycetota bacterium]|nr:hypothetical protein [Actinomycetota bacterium]